jgi:hypothetical protein
MGGNERCQILETNQIPTKNLSRRGTVSTKSDFRDIEEPAFGVNERVQQ